MIGLIIYMIVQTILAVAQAAIFVKRGALKATAFDQFKEGSNTLNFKFTEGAYLSYYGFRDSPMHAEYNKSEKTIYV